jgi:hypothetical protein
MEVKYTTPPSEVSGLSETRSSRKEHMAFLTNVMGMDPASAAMLYRAERLQEKGQLRQAIIYYETVLSKCSNCTEAIVNIRIVKELIVEEEEKKAAQQRLSVIPEKPDRPPSQGVITEMDIFWSGFEDHRVDYYPDPVACAFRAAKSQLRESGHGGSLLKLLENKTIKDVCNAHTDWEACLSGRARFQVTLIPDRVSTESVTFDHEALFQAMMAKQVLKQTETSLTAKPEDSDSTVGGSDGASEGCQSAGGFSMSSASRFADA